MRVAEATTQLQAKGFLVEYTSGNSSVYVRRSPNSLPWRLYVKDGGVSDRAVNTLLNKKAGME